MIVDHISNATTSTGYRICVVVDSKCLEPDYFYENETVFEKHYQTQNEVTATCIYFQHPTNDCDGKLSIVVSKFGHFYRFSKLLSCKDTCKCSKIFESKKRSLLFSYLEDKFSKSCSLPMLDEFDHCCQFVHYAIVEEYDLSI